MLTDEAASYDIWNCPAREPYLPFGDKGYRWGSFHYGVNGAYFLFMDERIPANCPVYPPHDNIDNVNVPAKTQWLNCNYAGSGGHVLNGWDNVVHLGSANYGFIDGHAKSYEFKPILDLWLSTGGILWRTGPYVPGESAYTYPPGLDNRPAEAQWWTIPWYPDSPHGWRSPGLDQWHSDTGR